VIFDFSWIFNFKGNRQKENSLVSIALLLTIKPIEHLFSAFINIKITQLNTIAVAVQSAVNFDQILRRTAKIYLLGTEGR
jgi:hypothetical protein